MIKIMIVEDEPPILRDVANLVERVSSSYSVCAQAYNVRSAMELIEKETPDVIITDVNMPVMSGLDLIEWIRKSKYDIIPIILSGFNEFEYAKKAMSMGVNYYLLKPVDIDELKNVLQIVEKDVLRKKSMQKNLFCSSLIENCSEVAKGYVSPGNEQYVIITFCVGSFPSHSIGYDPLRRQFWENSGLEAMIDTQLKKDESVWMFNGRNPAIKILLITFTNNDYKRLESINRLISEKFSRNQYSVTVAVGDFISNIEGIGKAVDKLTTVLNKRVALGCFQIIKMYEASEEPQYPYDRLLNTVEYDALYTYIKQGRISLFNAELKNLFAKWEKLFYPQIYIEKALRELLSMIERVSNDKTEYYIDVKFEMEEAISNALNYQMLFESIWFIFENFLQSRDHELKKADRHEYTVQCIEEYIIKNISLPLNNQILSEKFGLVPSYLSKLFREYKGVSPVDYITNLRIERAKNIFTEHPEFLSKDVAALVGYDDPFYFSKIFKKITGVAPSEYIRIRRS